MLSKVSMLMIPVVFLTLIVGAGQIPRVASQFVGVVCIAPSSSSSCPSTAATFTGSVGGQLVVAVNIQGSDALNGYDITVQTDSSVLQPVSVDFTGSLLPPPPPCLICPPPISGGTVNVAVVAFVLTIQPTTGRLFTITYNIVGGGSTSIALPSVIVANGSTVPDPETLLPGTFASPGFRISASASSLTLTKDTTATSTLTLTSLNGFTGTVGLGTTISPKQSRGPDDSVSPASLTLSAGGTGISTLTVSASNNPRTGTYTVTVSAVSGLIARQVTITVSVAK